jgi:hypothetical protein
MYLSINEKKIKCLTEFSNTFKSSYTMIRWFHCRNEGGTRHKSIHHIIRMEDKCPIIISIDAEKTFD